MLIALLIKDLGVTFQDDLKFGDHIKNGFKCQ